jgi:hypothetical protein
MIRETFQLKVLNVITWLCRAEVCQEIALQCWWEHAARPGRCISAELFCSSSFPNHRSCCRNSGLYICIRTLNISVDLHNHPRNCRKQQFLCITLYAFSQLSDLTQVGFNSSIPGGALLPSSPQSISL